MNEILDYYKVRVSFKLLVFHNGEPKLFALEERFTKYQEKFHHILSTVEFYVSTILKYCQTFEKS